MTKIKENTYSGSQIANKAFLIYNGAEILYTKYKRLRGNI